MSVIAAGMAKLADWLEKIVRVVAITLLVVLVCAVFFQVARRTVTGKSIIQIEEFSIVLASWLAFTTVAYALRKKVHVRIEVFTEKLPFYLRHGLMLVIWATILVACVSLVWYGFQLAQKKVMVPMTVLPVHSGYWYVSFPVGMSFSCFFLLDHVVQELEIMRKGPEAEKAASGDKEV